MSKLLDRLLTNQQRGSKPRCHLLTHGPADEVAQRLTDLIAPFGEVLPTDKWMPQGFDDVEEAQLHHAPRLLPSDLGQELLSWWLVDKNRNPRTPTWDIASTCRINGKNGLLLIEAKAHDKELISEEAGKRGITPSDSTGSLRNHLKIGWCLQDASVALAGETKLTWALSRDSNYQMCNRFAWSWKLTELGRPVILVYLGFLEADEMSDQGKPFATAREWKTLVESHSANLFPAGVWNRRWQIHGCEFIPLIKSMKLDLSDGKGS